MSRSGDLAVGGAVEGLLPLLCRELGDLVRIPSISGDDAPAGPIQAAHDLVADLLRDAGLGQVETLDLPDTNPIVVGELPAPDGAPTVLLYSHYDVVGAGDEALWSSPPFEPVERDGAMFGRGTADSKANVITHVGALRAWEGQPPVGIKVVIEGQEEVGSAFNVYPPTDPERFRADAMLIADMGSVRPGVPTLTVALRGMAVVDVELRTLAGAKHSGQFGGAAPDALLALLRALASLHDEHGDVAVEGLRREEWTGESYGDDEFRELAEVLPGRPLVGSGGLGSRIWSGPAITVTGIDGADGRRRAQRGLPIRAREDQLARPSRAGRRRSAGRARAPPRAGAPVRARAGGQGRRDRQRLRGRHDRTGLRGRPRGDGGRLGQRAGQRRGRRLDPTRQRAPDGGA